MSAFLSVGKTNAVALRLLIPAIGAWVLTADLDLPASQPLPTGKVVVTIGQETLLGTVDDRATGRFGEKAKVRVIAGAGKWESDAKPQDFHNDAGVTSSLVLSATASAIGEVLVEDSPISYGTPDYMRTSGPARRVLDGRVWYLDAMGVTHVVVSRPTSPPSKDVEILSWDADQRVAILSTDTVVWPGTVLTDPRFDTVTVRDVEQVFSAQSSRVNAWCAKTEGTRLLTAFRTMIEELGGLAAMRCYQYRIQQENSDGRLFLQAVRRAAGVPDALPLSIYPGMAGDTADHKPGSLCIVHFMEGDLKRPVVLGVDGTEPTERRIYSNVVKIGDASAQAVVTKADFNAFIVKLTTLLGAASAWLDGGTAAAALSLALTTPQPVGCKPNFTTKGKLT